MATSKSDSEQDASGVLAHVEHARAFGTALAKAADAYSELHAASEEKSSWSEDFSKNLEVAVEQFHEALAGTPKKVFDAAHTHAGSGTMKRVGGGKKDGRKQDEA
jgi:hypothetical protein